MAPTCLVSNVSARLPAAPAKSFQAVSRYGQLAAVTRSPVAAAARRPEGVIKRAQPPRQQESLSTTHSLLPDMAVSLIVAKVMAVLFQTQFVVLHPHAATLLGHLLWNDRRRAEAPSIPILAPPVTTSVSAVASSTSTSTTSPADAPIFVTSISHWTALNASAAASGLLLATVFVSDKAMAAHGALLDRLRQRFGSSCRFAFVRIGDGFHQRNAAARSGSPCAPGPLQQLLRGHPGSPAEAHLSCLAASHGLDVALCALLPDGVRAFPSLLLTAGVEVGSATRWGAVTRVGEMAQLVSDWDHVNRRFATALQEARARQQLAQLEMDAWVAGGEGKKGFEVLPRQGAVAAKVEEEVQRVWARVLA